MVVRSQNCSLRDGTNLNLGLFIVRALFDLIPNANINLIWQS